MESAEFFCGVGSSDLQIWFLRPAPGARPSWKGIGQVPRVPGPFPPRSILNPSESFEENLQPGENGSGFGEKKDV